MFRAKGIGVFPPNGTLTSSQRTATVIVLMTKMGFGEYMENNSCLTFSSTSDLSHHHDAASWYGLFAGPGHCKSVLLALL